MHEPEPEPEPEPDFEQVTAKVSMAMSLRKPLPLTPSILNPAVGTVTDALPHMVEECRLPVLDQTVPPLVDFTRSVPMLVPYMLYLKVNTAWVFPDGQV